MKMIFISNNWVDAHQQTRLRALLKMDLFIISLAAFRNYYSAVSQNEPIFLGNIQHGSYHKRITVYARLFYLLTTNTVSDCFIYVFGFDLMLVCLIFKIITGRKIKVIYEVPDIREIFFSRSIPGRLTRWIEKNTIPRVDLIIATSPDFISEYFTGFRKIVISNALVIENKIHEQDMESSLYFPEIRQHQKIRIGYFGVLRCPTSLDCLIKLSQNENFEVITWGIFMPLTQHYEKIIHETNHINYLGPFESPKELHQIYSMVDVIWAVYPFSNNKTGNHLLARTNRFYESLYFKKPLILQKGTADAERAVSLGNVALEINLKYEADTLRLLLTNLTRQNLTAWKEKLLKIPKEQCQITSEYNDLATWLQQNR